MQAWTRVHRDACEAEGGVQSTEGFGLPSGPAQAADQAA